MAGFEHGSQPRYAIAEAAYLTGVPKATLRTWFCGWPAGKKRSAQSAVIEPDRGAADPLTLSFFNVVEARFLAAYRNLGVPMQRVRLALSYVKANMEGVDRPLLARTFETDGRSLFVEFVGDMEAPQLLDVTAAGQLVWPEAVRSYFKSIDFDLSGYPVRVWLDSAHAIFVDPTVAWGLPAIAETGHRTEIIFERFDAGEDVEEIAEDFTLDPRVVQGALRWEQQARRLAA